jgi:hypothetical protein
MLQCVEPAEMGLVVKKNALRSKRQFSQRN